MMPAPNAQGDGELVRSALLAYLSYGFSVIPILPGTKKPFGLLLPSHQWAPYQRQPATQSVVSQWVDQRPDIGIGIVCGQVSGGLYCMDVDSIPFSTWIEERAAELKGVWVVKTGSGKLHLYVRSRQKSFTTVMVGGGEKLADIRGDGSGNAGPSYVVAPPSLHPLSNRSYETLYGSPEFIRDVVDARASFDAIRDKFLLDQHRPVPVSDPAEDEFIDFKIGAVEKVTPEAEAQARERISATNALSRRVRQALLYGADSGERGWGKAPTNSEVDHTCIRELVRAGWSPAEIQAVWQWTPLRLHKSPEKGSYGERYVSMSLTKAVKEEHEALEAASRAEGDNFKVVRVVRIGMEEPLYETTVQQTKPYDNTGTVLLGVEDLMDEHRFKRAVMKGVNFLPIIHDTLMGRKFEKFGALLLSMATDEVVPERATTGGHLRATIRAFIDDEARIEEPEEMRMVTLGWRYNGSVFVRPGVLLNRLQAVIRPAPKPEDVWSILRALGGQEVGHVWPDSKKETVWLLPTRRATE